MALSFADLLMQAMLDAGGINSSELARRVWGTVRDKRGYAVARNRDRISHYLRGHSYPNQENLQKIADALGVTVSELGASPTPAPPVPITPATPVPATITVTITVTIGD